MRNEEGKDEVESHLELHYCLRERTKGRIKKRTVIIAKRKVTLQQTVGQRVEEKRVRGQREEMGTGRIGCIRQMK